MNEPKPRSRNRISRYQRAQERREAQKRADQRFYNAIFSVIGVCVLVVLGLAMIAQSGSAPDIAGTGGEYVQTRFIGLTLLEWIGLAVVGVIALFMWRRFKR